MKTAAQASQKYAERAASASGDYVSGAEQTTKDQAAAAIAAAPIYAQAVQAAIQRGAFAKGLQKSGKAGWLRGIQAVGGERFATGVGNAAPKYARESARYDSARGAANSMPRGPRGSETNFARAKAVGMALRAAKVGSGS